MLLRARIRLTKGMLDRFQCRKCGIFKNFISWNASYFSTDKQKKRCRKLAQVSYISGATLFTCALLLEGIFVRIFLVPYLRESNFSPTKCILHKTFYDPRAGMQRCESRCAKVASAFPCLVVRVRILQPENKSWHSGYLFDQLYSFQRRKPFSVSLEQKIRYIPCHFILFILLV